MIVQRATNNAVQEFGPDAVAIDHYLPSSPQLRERNKNSYYRYRVCICGKDTLLLLLGRGDTWEAAFNDARKRHAVFRA